MASFDGKRRRSLSRNDTIRSIQEDFLTCNICLGSFKNPKSLACLHRYCETCLNAYVQSRNVVAGERFQCPMKCDEKTFLPYRGIQDLKTDFAMKGLDEFLSMKSSQRKLSRPDIKDVFGIEYSSSIPEESSMSSYHDTMDDEEEEERVVCATHQRVCELFCELQTCRVAVCVKCIASTHNGHKVVEIEDAVKEAQHSLAEHLQSVKARIVKAQQQKSESQEILRKVQNEAENVRNNLDRYEEEMVRSVHERINNAKNEVGAHVSARCSSLQDIVKQSDTELLTLHSLQEKLHHSIDHHHLNNSEHTLRVVTAKMNKMRTRDNPQMFQLDMFATRSRPVVKDSWIKVHIKSGNSPASLSDHLESATSSMDA